MFTVGTIDSDCTFSVVSDSDLSRARRAPDRCLVCHYQGPAFCQWSIPIYLSTRLHLGALAPAALGSTLAFTLSPYLSQGRCDSEAHGDACLNPTAPAHNLIKPSGPGCVVMPCSITLSFD